MNINIKLILGLLTTLALSTQASTYALAAIEPLNKVVALVNSQVITQNELNEKLNLVKKQMTATPDEALLQKQVLEQLITERVQLERAAQMGMSINEKGLDNIVSNIAKQNNMSVAHLRSEVTKEGLSFEEYKKNIKTQYLLSHLKQKEVVDAIEITQQEIDHFLKTAQAYNTQNTKYHLGHLLIPLPENPSPEQVAKAKKQAQEQIKKLNSESSANLEDLGWRNSAQLPTLFVMIVPTMRKNDIQGPIQSASGLHIVKLLDVQAQAENLPTNPADQKQFAQNKIRNRKAGEKIDAWIKQLRDAAYVQVYLGDNA